MNNCPVCSRFVCYSLDTGGGGEGKINILKGRKREEEEKGRETRLQ